MTSPIARHFLDVSESYDKASEDARKRSETSKRDVLRRLREPHRGRFVDAMGEATTDQERCDAVIKLWKELQEELDEMKEDADESGVPYDPTNPLEMEVDALKDFLNDLLFIKHFELLRDIFRSIAEEFD